MCLTRRLGRLWWGCFSPLASFLLVDADPSGSTSFQAGYLRGQVSRDRSILDLAMAHRERRLDESLFGISIDLPDSTVKLIPGVHSPNQARSLTPVWPDLARTLAELEATGQDVMVDAGRLGMVDHPGPLVDASDLILLVTRTQLPGLTAGQAWAKNLTDTLGRRGLENRLGVLLVGPDRPYTASEIERAFGIPVVASMAWDPVNAEVFSLGNTPSRKFAQAPITRSARTAAQSIQSRVSADRDELHNPLGA